MNNTVIEENFNMDKTQRYFNSIRKLPISDWRTISQFHRIIKNYRKINKLFVQEITKCDNKVWQ